jgi:hypothetical protein
MRSKECCESIRQLSNYSVGDRGRTWRFDAEADLWAVVEDKQRFNQVPCALKRGNSRMGVGGTADCWRA